jgi:2-polyprenyl-3-methyl-5-hydroxy-6-metoxy-1,4-benzoquinol methylase
MSITTPPAFVPSEGDAEALAARLLEASLATMEVATIHLGERLGLYRALQAGPATAAELAARAGTDERYTREWLEQQAVAGILTVADGAAAPTARRFTLPLGHAEALLDTDRLSCLGPLARLVIGTLATMEPLLDAFRTGAGIPYADFGADVREGISEMNRPMFVNQLGTEWLPAVADVHARLSATPAARVADIACGCGWSSISTARAYPRATVDGFDVDEASVAAAQRNAVAAGVGERCAFACRDAADPDLEGAYDLVTIFEAVHDMGRPVEALRTARRLLAPGGCVIVGDERVADAFAAPGDQTERLMYGFSVLHCLPVGRADAEESAATGTVMRHGTLREYARAAGFRDAEVLPIEHDFWRFYRLEP